MIDVILILAAIIGLTIVAVRYGRRLLALGGMVLAWFKVNPRNYGGGIFSEDITYDLINNPAYSGLIGNAAHDDSEDC